MTVFFVFTIMIAGYVLIIATCYYCFRDGYKVGYKRGQALDLMRASRMASVTLLFKVTTNEF